MQEQRVTGREIQMILTKAPLNTGAQLSPSQEREHKDNKRQNPNEKDRIKNALSGNNGFVTKWFVYGCNTQKKSKLSIVRGRKNFR